MPVGNQEERPVGQGDVYAFSDPGVAALIYEVARKRRNP